MQKSLNIEGVASEDNESKKNYSKQGSQGDNSNNENNLIIKLEKELEIKENIIKEKEEEINKYILINEKLVKDNTLKQEKIQELMENSQEEKSFQLTLDKLKQEIKEDKAKINNLTKENKELNNILNSKDIPISYNKINKNKKSIVLRDDYENNNYHSDNRHENNNRLRTISGITTASFILTNKKKMNKYKKKVDEYKEQVNLHLITINTLKEEIKELKIKLKNSFFKNEEFIKLFKIAFEDYKPIKKEQKEENEQINKNFLLNNISNI